MNYKLELLEPDIADIITETAIIRTEKGRQYGSEEDVLLNVRIAGGWRNCVGQCIQSLIAMQKQCFIPFNQVNDKSMENLSVDLINYALYGLILYRQEKNQMVGMCENIAGQYPSFRINGECLRPAGDKDAGHIPPPKSKETASLPLGEYMKLTHREATDIGGIR